MYFLHTSLVHKHHQAEAQRAACEQKPVPVIQLPKKEMHVKSEQSASSVKDEPQSPTRRRRAKQRADTEDQPAIKTEPKKERKLSVVKEESEYEGDDEDYQGTVAASYACDEDEWYATGNAESDPYL